jgi:predicted peroxiredoxin
MTQISKIEPAEITLEEELQNALVKANITDEVIEALNKKASEAAKPIKDHAQYLRVKEVNKEIAKVRLVGQKNLQAIDRRRIDRNAYERDKVQELLAKIQQPELILAGVLAPWEREQERLVKEEQDRLIALKEGRKSILTELGYVFVPGPPENRYELEGVVIGLADVMNDDHLTWSNKMLTYRSHAEEVQSKREEELQRKTKEEQLAAEKRKEEEDRLARERAELDAQKEQIVKMVTSARKSELAGLGLKEHAGGLMSLMRKGAEFEHRVHDVNLSGIGALSELEWFEVLEGVNTAIKKEAEALKQLEKAKLLSSRKSMLIEHGWDILVGEESMFLEEEAGGVTIGDEVILSTNQEFLDKLARKGDEEIARRKEEAWRKLQESLEAERVENERLEKERERERQEGLSDLERWNEWVQAIENCKPMMSSNIGKQSVKDLSTHIKTMTGSLNYDLQ